MMMNQLHYGFPSHEVVSLIHLMTTESVSLSARPPPCGPRLIALPALPCLTVWTRALLMRRDALLYWCLNPTLVSLWQLPPAMVMLASWQSLRAPPTCKSARVELLTPPRMFTSHFRGSLMELLRRLLAARRRSDIGAPKPFFLVVQCFRFCSHFFALFPLTQPSPSTAFRWHGKLLWGYTEYRRFWNELSFQAQEGSELCRDVESSTI